MNFTYSLNQELMRYRGYAGNVVDRVLKLNLIKMEESYQEEY